MPRSHAGDRSAISVSGFDAMRSVIRVMGKEAQREANKVLKEAARVVADDARQRAERQPYKTPADRRDGKYAAGFKVALRGSRIMVVNRWPGAGVNHWGGTISPKGTPIRFSRRPVIAEAADAKSAIFEAHLEQAVNRLADSIR